MLSSTYLCVGSLKTELITLSGNKFTNSNWTYFIKTQAFISAEYKSMGT